jgi:hypothetical protein
LVIFTKPFFIPIPFGLGLGRLSAPALAPTSLLALFSEAVLLKKEPKLPTIERQPSYGHLLLRLGGVTRKPKL